MSAATRKPPAGGVGRISSTESTSPSSSPVRNPPRSSTPTGSAPGSVARTRSIRSGTPVSARAAAGRRESPLSNSGTDADPDARAETIAALDDLKECLAKAETSSEQYRRQAEVLQSKLDDVVKEQAKLEEKLHEGEEQIETLRNEKREIARQMREMEAIYEAERSSMTKEKEEMANREEEMQLVIQRLKDGLAQRNNADDDGRPSRQANNSPSVDGGNFAPPSSLQRSDSRNNSKLVLQKDKLIESLRLELAEAQIKLVESENQGGGRLHEVERLLMEARMANARLMEDNESYQLLLQEKTLHGDFGKGDFSYMGGASANQDALNALEGRSGSTSLADELSGAAETEDDGDLLRRTEAELRSMRDQNKALTLYINKIIERLLQHQDFEHILDQSSDFKPGANTNKELPPPPPSGPTLLQRAKSIAVSATKPRPRPMSVMPTPVTAHNDPTTAPSIPISNLTRSSSTRRARPMSEQFTGGASLVSQMYKGDHGPVSPPLGPPRSQTFLIPSPLSGSVTPGNRASSGTQVPTTGNFPGMRSETSSTSGDSNDLTTPPSNSPPRAQQEKATTFTGGKPRPLRLVQENPDAVKDASKRGSWIDWAWQKKEELTSGMGGTSDSTIPE